MSKAPGEILWSPDAARIESTRLTAFQRLAAERTGESLDDYEALHAWSIRDPAAFWTLVWDFCDIRGDRNSELAVENLQQFPGARWFPDAELNYAENLLRRHDDTTALISYLENGERRTLTWRDLYQQSASLAHALQRMGIRMGDRVAAWLPNIPEAVTAMLGATSIGATFSSCSPDFGASGALDRFGQIEPRVLFACDGYYYNGKRIDVREKVREVVAQTPSIEQVIWISVIGEVAAGDTTLESLTGDDVEHPFVQVPFNHPLYILFSSGTTGKPKCIVHGTGGTLLQHQKEHRLHCDLNDGERLFFFTTCGWMMWNWLVGALAANATLILYDGSPFYPGPSALFDIAERERIPTFGISAKYLQSIENAGLKPADSHDLSAMRLLISTGSVLPPEGFNFVYEAIKSDVHLVSMTGGTDIVSCFVLGNPNKPVYCGELQSPGLGMAADVWDDKGQPVVNTRGELICSVAFPSAPLGFLNDESGERFRSAYFDKYPNVWAQGDFAERTANGGFIIHGRSDAVLNPGGVRIGTAEIYRQVERFEEVLEAVCIGQQWQGDVRVVLFVVLRSGELSEALAAEIRTAIRTHASPRHVPAKIIAVRDIPRTMSGKIAELAVRDVVHGRTVANTSALANPEALKLYENLPELTR